MVAALQASEIVAVDIGGIYADLSPAPRRTSTRLTPLTGKVLRNDGGTDEVFGIEGVLGTAYEDILAGDDLENYLAAGAGDDISPVRAAPMSCSVTRVTTISTAATAMTISSVVRARYLVRWRWRRLRGRSRVGRYDPRLRCLGDTLKRGRRGGVNDQVEFGFTDTDLTGRLVRCQARWGCPCP